MATSRTGSVWTLARSQHDLITHDQLTELGYSRAAIQHRVATGRLHRRARGVFAVGRPAVSREGGLMVAVLAGGPGAVVSDRAATALWGIEDRWPRLPEVTLPGERGRRLSGVVVHCRSLDPRDITRRLGIPVTTPARTLLDAATSLSPNALERAINQADALDLMSPVRLRRELVRFAGRPGVAALRAILDRDSYRVTDSVLEQRFLRLLEGTSLRVPDTHRRPGRWRVDFHWPELDLVVEADSLRFHRTASQQLRDHLRDQAHAAAGMLTLRFTHHQIVHRPEHVRRTLAAALANRPRRPG